ncbi:hypothetical protein ACIQ7N_01665 [Lysinibacillus sp. NPDC095746]|uniref:hypothetical protein n=1 Tax=Lysinibacillus sp. NPDC095746 TaxID=3364134 RepID=UPI003813BA74
MSNFIFFKNRDLKALSDFVMAMELSVKESRMRTKFNRIIAEQWNIGVIAEVDAIILDRAEIGQDGKPMRKSNDSNTIQFKSISSEEEAINLITELENEEFYIDLTPSSKDMILSVANSILNCDLKVSNEVAILIDSWCEQFENALEYYEALNKEFKKAEQE